MQQNLPRHVAIIPDGNRRWAKAKGLPVVNGYLEGRLRFREISQVVFDVGIPYFTFWSMSKDNFHKRSTTLVNFLLSLFKEELHSRTMDRILRNQIRFRVLGNWRDLMPNDTVLAKLIDEFEDKTKGFDRHHLTIMLGYSGTTELATGVLNMIRNEWKPSCSAWTNMVNETAEKIKESLWSRELPPVDLLIRTGEEVPGWMHNSSGFMMLHTTDSEIYSSPTLWPGFSEEEFRKIVTEYGQRERKLGK